MYEVEAPGQVRLVGVWSRSGVQKIQCRQDERVLESTASLTPPASARIMQKSDANCISGETLRLRLNDDNYRSGTRVGCRVQCRIRV
jgi:hypothetical protein